MAYNNDGNCPDPSPGYNWSSINASMIDATSLPNKAPISINIEMVQEEPSLIPMSLRFELIKTDLDCNPITDSDSCNDDHSLFVGAVTNLVFLEYKNGRSKAPTYSYSPGKRINLDAQKTKSGDICYTILLPLSDDSSDNTVIKFPSEKFSETSGNIADLFDFIVEASKIPNGEVNSAINDLSFIVDNQIAKLSDEITKIE